MSVQSAVRIDWADGEDLGRAVAAVAKLLPASLDPIFDAPFARSHLMFDEYVYRLTLGLVGPARLDAALADWGGAEDVVARAGFEPGRSLVPVGWMLRHLAARGAIAREEGASGPRFKLDGALAALDASAILAEQRAHDARCLPSYQAAETAARDYPAFLRGERTGEAILFAPARLSLWTSYFSNDNPLYAVNNRVGAAAFETWLRPGAGRVLELGGGLGSGTAALLERLAAAGRLGEIESYRFTELVPAFLRRAERLKEKVDGCPLTFAPLDMNRPFGEQGIAPGSVSIVYAVNVLHIANDLAFTLAEARRALEPGGQLIVSEGVRPTAAETMYPEFIFNLLETFRTGGFLTIERWRAAFEAAGFENVRAMPDVARIREVFPTFYAAAIGATR